MEVNEKPGTNFSTLTNVSESAVEDIIFQGIEKAKETPPAAAPAAGAPAAGTPAAGTDFTKVIPQAAAAAAAEPAKTPEAIAAEDAIKYPGKSAEEITALKTQEAADVQAKAAIQAEKTTKIDAAKKEHDEALKTAVTDEEKKIIADKLLADTAAIEAQYKEAEPAQKEFKVPGSEGANAEESDGWANLAKAQGLPDLEADTFEAYQAKLDAHYKAKYEPDLGKYNPEAQLLIEYLNADPENSVESFKAPLKPITDLLQLSPVELVAKNLEAENFTEEEITKQIEDWTERGMIEIEDKKIRNSLNKLKAQKENEIVQNALRAKERSDNYAKVTESKLFEGIKSSLATESEFMGIPITKEVRQFITNKLEKGEYANEIKNPALIVKGILLNELGKQAQTIIAATAKEPYMDEAKKKLHNIPADQKSAAGSGGSMKAPSITSEGPAEGNWKRLENFEENFNGQVVYS